jgi:hypothetical protein
MAMTKTGAEGRVGEADKTKTGKERSGTEVGMEKEVLVRTEVLEREASGAGIGQREGVTVHRRKP